MKFGKLLLLLFFLIYEMSFSLVIGKTIKEEETDCVKLSSIVPQDSYSNCCDNDDIQCDGDNYIISLKM